MRYQGLTFYAEILSESGRHEEAAWLFTKAENHKKAVQEYAELNKHEKVLAACYYAGLYNELAAHLKECDSYTNLDRPLANRFPVSRRKSTLIAENSTRGCAICY